LFYNYSLNLRENVFPQGSYMMSGNWSRRNGKFLLG